MYLTDATQTCLFLQRFQVFGEKKNHYVSAIKNASTRDDQIYGGKIIMSVSGKKCCLKR